MQIGVSMQMHVCQASQTSNLGRNCAAHCACVVSPIVCKMLKGNAQLPPLSDRAAISLRFVSKPISLLIVPDTEPLPRSKLRATTRPFEQPITPPHSPQFESLGEAARQTRRAMSTSGSCAWTKTRKIQSKSALIARSLAFWLTNCSRTERIAVHTNKERMRKWTLLLVLWLRSAALQSVTLIERGGGSVFFADPDGEGAAAMVAAPAGVDDGLPTIFATMDGDSPYGVRAGRFALSGSVPTLATVDNRTQARRTWRGLVGIRVKSGRAALVQVCVYLFAVQVLTPRTQTQLEGGRFRHAFAHLCRLAVLGNNASAAVRQFKRRRQGDWRATVLCHCVLGRQRGVGRVL